MFRVSRFLLIALSGGTWFIVGTALLTLGIKFLIQASTIETTLLTALSGPLGGKEEGAIVLMVIALLLGRVKAKKVLSKVANRGIERIGNLKEPASLSSLYNKSYLLLIALMMSFGILMNLLGVPKDVRGFIDLAVGAALVNGSFFYFQRLFVIDDKKSL